MNAAAYGSYIQSAPGYGMEKVDGNTLVGVVESDVNLVSAETLPLLTEWDRLSADEKERAIDALKSIARVANQRLEQISLLK